MKLFAQDPITGGIIRDTGGVDNIFPGDGADLVVLSNDGEADAVWGLEDGVDKIDIQAWDAVWEELSIKQISWRRYELSYRQEEKLTIRFKRPDPEDTPEDRFLLTEDDFIFRPGLPAAQTQVLFEQRDDTPEVMFGTSLPDEFVFQRDGQRDTIRKFEPGKDVIDLADYNMNFFDLKINEQKVGRVTVRLPREEEGERADKLVIIDLSKQITAEDVSADWFIF
ncbi:MAG: hypothetical protein AAGF22_02100 [Pseudomonadota bacterium]